MSYEPLPDAGKGDAYEVTLTIWLGEIGGTAADLGSDVLTAWAEDQTGATVATAEVTPVAGHPEQGLISFAAGALPRGQLWIKARLAHGGILKTVWWRPLRVW